MLNKPREMPIYLKPREVGELLQINREGIYRLIHLGEIPAVRVGRKQWRVPTFRLFRLLEGQSRF